MECPQCHFKNIETAKFCNECGQIIIANNDVLAKEPSLQEKLQALQKYLPKGLPEKILAQKDKIEGERRQVTVMFCDMEGFVPLVQKLGAEEAYALMDQVYEILIHNVHDYEGTVNEMTGDGIMALFGAPIALEDAPQRALFSALAIHGEITKFNTYSRVKSPIHMRIGIHTGPVVLGTLGNDLRVEFKAVGDTVNLASRMESLAEPGTTFVTVDTFRQANRLFLFDTKGKRAVKGKEGQISVYKLLSRKKGVHRPRLGSERIIYSEMVGRDKELATLELQVMKAIKGDGSVVNIIGEAGIGKSRLVAELKKRDVMKSAFLLEGRAISIGRNLSFHPIIDIVRQRCRITEDDSEETVLSKLEVLVRRVHPEEVSELLPFLATLMGMKLSGKYAQRVKDIEGEGLEKLILKSVRELLVKVTELTPLVIVLEDMHWVDTSSINLLESLYRLAGTQRILFVNVFRPGIKETGDRIVNTIKDNPEVYYVEILMEPLDEKRSETLISNILPIGDLHQSLIKTIVHQTSGNPFFIEEVVRSLIDENAVIVKDGKFRVTEKIAKVAIPNSINEVLMSRVDRLEGETRDLVKIASVIGRNFLYRILSEAASAVKDLDTKLAYLKEIQLIRERRRKEGIEYLFKHALTQEATYESILPEKRKELHLRIANSIEKVFLERLHEFYGMLAFHYSRAESLEKAEEYLTKAGEEALKSSASNEALYYYEEALFLYLKKHGNSADPEKVAILKKNIALALYNRGQYNEAMEYFDGALDHYWGKLPKNPVSGGYQFLSGFLHFLVSLYLPSLKFKKIPKQEDSASIDLFFKKLKALVVLNPKQFFIQSFYFYRRVTEFDLSRIESGPGILVGASSFFSFTGISFKLSKKILEFVKDKVLKEDIQSNTVYDFSETLHNYLEGNWKEIKDCDEDLVSKNLAMGDIYFAAQHYYWHACPKLHQGCFDAPQLLVKKLEDLYKTYGNEFPMLLRYLLSTSLLIERRQLHEALIEIEKGIEFGQNLVQGTILVEMYSRKAHTYILLGDIDQAEIALNLADKVRKEIETVPWQLTDFFRSQLELHLCKLKATLSSGDRKNSAQYRRKAKRSAKKLLKTANKVALIRPDAFRLMGVYYWLVKKQKKAARSWTDAIKQAHILDARIDLSRAYFEIGKRLLEAPSQQRILEGMKPDDYLEKARALFEELNLDWDLDELDRVAVC